MNSPNSVIQLTLAEAAIYSTADFKKSASPKHPPDDGGSERGSPVYRFVIASYQLRVRGW